MEILKGRWVILDGCSSLYEVVHRLNTIRNNYISLYRHGAVVSVPFTSDQGSINLKQSILKTRKVELASKIFPTLDLTLNPGRNSQQSSYIYDNEMEPTFHVIRANNILNGCVSMEDVINTLEKAILHYKTMYYDGWELSNDIGGNHGFLFPSRPFYVADNAAEEGG